VLLTLVLSQLSGQQFSGQERPASKETSSSPASRAAPASRPATLDELVAALAEVRAKVGERRAFRAPVVQEVRTPQLAKPVRSEGTLWFEAPDRFRLELVRPRRSCVVLKGEAFASFRGEDPAQVAAGAGGSLSREITELLSLADAPETLRNIATRRRVEGTVTDREVEVRLLARAKDEKILERYSEVMIRVRRTDGQPASLLLAAEGGDRTEFRLGEAERMESLPESLFRTDRFTPAAK
jgi:hypothetical protein